MEQKVANFVPYAEQYDVMISIETLKEIMLENRTEIAQRQIYARDISIGEFPCQVLVGVRRAGKSYILFEHIQRLLREGRSWSELLYINFEDERLIGMDVADLNTLLEAHAELSAGQRPTLFLDEIQNIAGWEKFARRLADSKYSVFITGSNAKMLSSDVATTLGGRYLVKHVFPFSFSEYLVAKGVNPAAQDFGLTTKSRGEIKNLFEDYFTFGGFPEALHFPVKRDYLLSLYGKLYLGDIAARHSISNTFALRVMFRKLAESIKQPVSFTRIANIVNSTGVKVGKASVINYIDYAEEACLITAISNFADNLTDRVTSRKYYFIDNGIISLLATDIRTTLLENLVAIALLRRYGKNDAVYYYGHGVEVDFYVPDAALAVQVCYNIDKDGDTFARETNALVKLSRQMPVRQALIITYNEVRTVEVDGISIDLIPAWRWLVELPHNEQE